MTGADIRAFRDRHKLSLAKMAGLVEPPIDRANLQKIEAGKREIGRVMAHRLMLAMRARPAGE